MSDPRQWSRLTPEELKQLADLTNRWQRARKEKRFDAADLMRVELVEWGAYPPERGWHPVFESPAHRKARIEARSE